MTAGGRISFSVRVASIGSLRSPVLLDHAAIIYISEGWQNRKPAPILSVARAPHCAARQVAYKEGEFGELFLFALLTGNRATGMPAVRVTSVRFQGVEQGFKPGDLIIEGVGADGDALSEI